MKDDKNKNYIIAFNGTGTKMVLIKQVGKQYNFNMQELLQMTIKQNLMSLPEF